MEKKEQRDIRGKDLIRHLVEKLKTSPIKVISAAIYGSWAKGTQQEDSDLDLLIVSNDVSPKRSKRRKEILYLKTWLSVDIPLDILLLTKEETIANFKGHNPLFLDIATEAEILLDHNGFLRGLIEETCEYIKDRRIEKLDDGWRFPVDYRKISSLSPISNKDFAFAMLTDGKRDFEIGQILIEKGYFDKAVYHFQQSIEKAVKAVLLCFGEFKRTHFVGSFLRQKLKVERLPEEWKERLYATVELAEEIEPEVTWSRYPGIDQDRLWMPYEEYHKKDAEEVREKAQEVLMTAEEFLDWWFRD